MKQEQVRILIGYDGSACADAMLDDLRRAGLPCHAEALIVSVAERWLPRPAESAIAEAAFPHPLEKTVRKVSLSAAATGALGAASELALKARERVRAFFPEWEVNAEALSGSPARELLRWGKTWRADLLCIASQGRSVEGCSGRSRMFLGSVSTKVANEAACSVRVARGDVWKYGAPVRILIGLDGSSGADAAVCGVAQRLWPMESEVRLVVVADAAGEVASRAPLPQLSSGRDGKNNHEWIKEIVELATDTLRATGLTVTARIETGDPKQLLIACAEEWGADCLFIGERGAQEPLIGPMAGMLLGSVSTAVIARAHCTVEIVRPEVSDDA